jgi:hypothetical protein
VVFVSLIEQLISSPPPTPLFSSASFVVVVQGEHRRRRRQQQQSAGRDEVAILIRVRKNNSAYASDCTTATDPSFFVVYRARMSESVKS